MGWNKFVELNPGMSQIKLIAFRIPRLLQSFVSLLIQQILYTFHFLRYWEFREEDFKDTLNLITDKHKKYHNTKQLAGIGKAP